MRLPNGDRAVVDIAKVRDYLLSPTHPVGRSKARFFARLGFEQRDWVALQAALLALAAAEGAREGRPSRFGRKYEVRGILVGALGSAAIVAVWMILDGEELPRLVTVYPGDEADVQGA